MSGWKDFKKKEVGQIAHELAVYGYADSPGRHDFFFYDQMKGAAASVSNTIAEASERPTRVEFSRYLDITKRSPGEVRSMYMLAERIEFCSKEVVENRCEIFRSILLPLAGFAKHLRHH